MSELIVETNYSRSYLKDDIVYATAHDSPNSESMGNIPEVGQYLSGGVYGINRAGLMFDTSALSGNIITAVLSIYGSVDDSATDFNLTVINGADLNNPSLNPDYGELLDDTTSGGIISTASWVLSAYNDITLNATGRGWITKGGTTKLAFRSSRDINSDVPIGMERIEFLGIDDTNPAKLTITYNPFVPKIFYF